MDRKKLLQQAIARRARGTMRTMAEQKRAEEDGANSAARTPAQRSAASIPQPAPSAEDQEFEARLKRWDDLTNVGMPAVNLTQHVFGKGSREHRFAQFLTEGLADELSGMRKPLKRR